MRRHTQTLFQAKSRHRELRSRVYARLATSGPHTLKEISKLVDQPLGVVADTLNDLIITGDVFKFDPPQNIHALKKEK